jgi:hypothetical protein
MQTPSTFISLMYAGLHRGVRIFGVNIVSANYLEISNVFQSPSQDGEYNADWFN